MTEHSTERLGDRFKIILMSLGQKQLTPFMQVVLSIFSLLLLATVHIYWSEEKLLNEGGKELVNIINGKKIFLLHPERWPLFITQILPVVGVWMELQLKWLVYLYSFNVVFITVLISVACMRMGERMAGFYLTAINFIGIGLGFFLYPFSEPLYALLFSYLLWRLLSVMDDSPTRMVFAALLVVYISSFHQNAFLFPMLAVLAAGLSLRATALLWGLSIVVFLVSLILTEVDAGSRLSMLELTIYGPLHFASSYPVITALALASLVHCWTRLHGIGWFIVLITSLVPALFYEQVPDSYSLITAGSTVFYWATYTRHRPRWWIVGVIAISIFFNLTIVSSIGQRNREIKNVVCELVQTAQEKGNKKNATTSQLISDPYMRHHFESLMDGAIRHSSLIFSSLDGSETSVVIDDVAFHRLHFPSAFSKSENELLSLHRLYDTTVCENLHESLGHEYEYARYFFTNPCLNDYYFDVGTAPPVWLLDHP
ncbi:hypothetical protein N9J52_01680 [Flavobacteriales bacterium]|nr:hypothetical protein [Flavobacteriales bacterium]